MKRVFFLILVSFLFFQCNTSSRMVPKTNFQFIKEIKQIRVLLDDGSQFKDLKFDCTIVLRANQTTFAEVRAGEMLQIQRKNNLLEIRTKTTKYTLESADIYPVDKTKLLTYKNHLYRGILRFRCSGSRIALINVLGIEDYLRSVVFSEMGPANKAEDFEALKAFAVCLRNYTYMKIRESKGIFDVYSDSRDQVYKGASAEKDFSNRAISETEGLVLEYKGQLAKTFYYSSCGGHTENSDNVFSEKGIEYLSGVQDGNEPYCRISPSFGWTEKYNSSELVSMLRKAKYLDGLDYEIKNVEVKSRFNSGRVNELKITVENSESEKKHLYLIGNSIRGVIQSKDTKGILRSTFFDIETDLRGNQFHSLKIIGRGNGHGVGFCQWGAISQSKSGKKFDELLYFYFPGTNLSEI